VAVRILPDSQEDLTFVSGLVVAKDGRMFRYDVSRSKTELGVFPAEGSDKPAGAHRMHRLDGARSAKAATFQLARDLVQLDLRYSPRQEFRTGVATGDVAPAELAVMCQSGLLLGSQAGDTSIDDDMARIRRGRLV